jgi:hypothetical protein
MNRIKHVATMLALVCSFGAALASEAAQVTEHTFENKTVQVSVELQKDNIEFMQDNQLDEVQGALSYKDAIKHAICAFRNLGAPSSGKKVMHCVRHFRYNPTF